MARLLDLIAQGVAPQEVYERSLYDPVLEQEIVYAGLKRLEPTTDILPRIDLWPGRVERSASRHSHHHGKGNVQRRFTDINARTYRPWRALTTWWPNTRSVVEIQTRGSNNTVSGKIPKAYHVDKIWYDADTGKRIHAVVERWRMCSVND